MTTEQQLRSDLERTDWTPKEALQFYADQRNFDIVNDRARIIDNGAIASNALKHLDVERLMLKGDAELFELRDRIEQLEAENARLKTNEVFMTLNAETHELIKQLAAAQLDNKKLREALDELVDLVQAIRAEEYKPDSFTCQPALQALATPSDTYDLDAYVAEKIEEALGNEITFDGKTGFQFVGEELFKFQNATQCDTAEEYDGKIATLTRQRDLAVEALEYIKTELRQGLNCSQTNIRLRAESTLSAIKDEVIK